MPFDLAVRVMRIKLWDKGHSFEEIDGLSIDDLGDVLGYYHEISKAREILEDRKKKKK